MHHDFPIRYVPAEYVECLTEDQKSVFEMYQAGMLAKDIAKARGVHRRNLLLMTANMRKRIRGAGYDPDAGLKRMTAPPFTIKGRSELVKIGEDGSETVVMQWNKTEREKVDAGQSLREYVEGMKDEIPRIKPEKEPKRIYRNDLMPAIFIGDAHIGMRAWGKETRHLDFDTGIAVAQLREGIDYLIGKAEPADVGLLVDVGDYTHADGHSNTTTAGTSLDVDTRHRSTMYQAAQCMRYMIGRGLQKFRKLYVVVSRGNHNDNVAPAIELMLHFAYENEPRVEILPTTGYYHYVEYGNWLLGITHGDKQKPESLAGSMARDMAEAWGRTTHRMWCTGHFHKDAVKTLPGVKHKVFAALPPPDSWHASRGYAGDGEMEMWTFKKSGGVHSTHVFNIPQPRIEPDVRIA
jgi:hypothetical protein